MFILIDNDGNIRSMPCTQLSLRIKAKAREIADKRNLNDNGPSSLEVSGHASFEYI